MLRELVRWSADEATRRRMGLSHVCVVGHSWCCHLCRAMAWMSHWVLFQCGVCFSCVVVQGMGEVVCSVIVVGVSVCARV